VIRNAEDFAQDAGDLEAVLGMRGDPDQGGQPRAGRAVALLFVRGVELHREAQRDEFR
jgi:hypothetical protein